MDRARGNTLFQTHKIQLREVESKMRGISKVSTVAPATITVALLALGGCGSQSIRVEAGAGGPPPAEAGASPSLNSPGATAPLYKPGQITDRYPTRASALAALRATQEGGVLRRIDSLDAKLSTVDDMRRLAPGLDLPIAWPGARDVWVYLAEGQVTNITSDKIDSWIIQVIGGPSHRTTQSMRPGLVDLPMRAPSGSATFLIVPRAEGLSSGSTL